MDLQESLPRKLLCLADEPHGTLWRGSHPVPHRSESRNQPPGALRITSCGSAQAVRAHLAIRQVGILRLQLRRHVRPLKAVRVRLLPRCTPLLHLRTSICTAQLICVPAAQQPVSCKFQCCHAGTPWSRHPWSACGWPHLAAGNGVILNHAVSHLRLVVIAAV